jgi:fluoride ion exporter CrcB/FEX
MNPSTQAHPTTLFISRLSTISTFTKRMETIKKEKKNFSFFIAIMASSFYFLVCNHRDSD